MEKTKEDFIYETLKLWQSRTPRQLDREDARQISENIAGFFGLLLEWENAERQSSIPTTDASLSKAEGKQSE